VGLVAILEIGIMAALAAAISNWLLLRRASRPGRAAQQAEEAEGAAWVWGGQGGLEGTVFPQNRGGPRGSSPGESTVPPDQYDETDDAGGHRIYLNPWAAGEQDDW
jgi:hypothetical protein